MAKLSFVDLKNLWENTFSEKERSPLLKSMLEIGNFNQLDDIFDVWLDDNEREQIADALGVCPTNKL